MLKLEPVALTDVGRKRDHNEDYLGDQLIRSGRSFGPEKLEERGYLFAVADGMGGHAAGEVASELAITTLFEEYYNAPTSGSPAADLARAVSLSNAEVHNAGTSGGRGQMGTTLTLSLLKGNHVLVGNVGDSRTYLIRQGIALRVTRDHSLVQDQIDMGALTPEQAEHSLIRNVITRAIGHRPDVDADFFEQDLQKDDVILLCSDGLHGQVKEAEMGAIVASTANLKEAAQQLINLANERGGPDNISVVLIRILEVGDAIPPLLDGHVNNSHVFQQATVPVNVASGAADGSTVMGDMTTSRIVTGKPAAEKTDRYTPIPARGKGTAIDNQATQPRIKTVSGVEAEPKESRAGAIILILALLIIIVGGVIIFILNSGDNTSRPFPVPVTTATATVPPTVTPAPTLKANPGEPKATPRINQIGPNASPTPVVGISSANPNGAGSSAAGNSGAYPPTLTPTP